MRNNPAEPDYQIRKLLTEIADVKAQLTRVQSDSHSISAPGSGTTESIIVDPENPHLFIVTSDSIDPTAHVLSVPISTLLVPDTTNPRLFVLPMLSV